MTFYEIFHAFENGRKIVVVPLSNSKRTVKLYETDYNELVVLGVGLPWKWMQETVYVRSNNQNISIARLIVDADKGQRVSYLDGDPTNLTRPNLIRIAASSKYRARARIARSFRRNEPQIKHTKVHVREGLNIK